MLRTVDERAADELSELFNFNVPMRWSVSHYYETVLDKEEHIDRPFESLLPR